MRRAEKIGVAIFALVYSLSPITIWMRSGSALCRLNGINSASIPISPNTNGSIVAGAGRAGDPTLFQNDGWIIASTNSATIDSTTSHAHPHSQRSQDSDPLSIASSAAFIVPSRKYQAVNGFWVGLAWGTLVFTIAIGVFLGIGLYLQWPL